MTVDQHYTQNDTQLKQDNGKVTPQDVGLIFAREYYTFLNKRPNRLHAFYGSDSLLVRGDEGETVSTAKGQEAIRKQIEELEFDNCKVLVTQVDSQISAGNGILVSVLGEISNKRKPSQKFAETFFLAPQLNGYYILNNIFRYLKDKVDIDYHLREEDDLEETKSPNQNEVPVVDNHSNQAEKQADLKEVEEDRCDIVKPEEEANKIVIKKIKKDEKNKKDGPARDLEKGPEQIDTISPNLPVSSAPVVQDKESHPPVVQDKESHPPVVSDRPTPAAAVAPTTSATSNVPVKSVVENTHTSSNNTKKTQPYQAKDNESQITNEYKARDQRGFQKPTTNAQTWARLAASTTSESINEPTGTTKPHHQQQQHYPNQQAPLTQNQAHNSPVHVQNNNLPHNNNYNHHPQNQNSHHHPYQYPNGHQQHAQNNYQNHHKDQQPHYQNKDQQQHQSHHAHQNQNQHHQHQRSKDTQIFVKNVTNSMTEEQLEQAFIRFGPIKNVNIGHLRNCAFIDFQSIESTQRAIEQHKVMIGTVYVLAEERRPKGYRQPFDNNNNHRRYQQNHRRGGGTAGTAMNNRTGNGPPLVAAGVVASLNNKRGGGGVTGGSTAASGKQQK